LASKPPKPGDDAADVGDVGIVRWCEPPERVGVGRKSGGDATRVCSGDAGPDAEPEPAPLKLPAFESPDDASAFAAAAAADPGTNDDAATKDSAPECGASVLKSPRLIFQREVVAVPSSIESRAMDAERAAADCAIERRYGWCSRNSVPVSGCVKPANTIEARAK